MFIGIGIPVTNNRSDDGGPDPSAPVNLIAPVVSPASGFVGAELSTTTGDWSGVPLPDFTYQWFVDGAEAIGETSSSITALTAGDYTCVVTATNSEGNASETSSAVTISTGPAQISGLLPAGAADFTDPAQWPTSADFDVSGGDLTFLNTSTAVNALSSALSTNILNGRHYAVYLDVTRRANGVFWYGAGVSGGANQGTAINASRRVLDSFIADRDIDEFGVRGTPFDGDVDFAQVYDITDEIAGELGIHILAGQSNMVGASAETGLDSPTEEPELRALSISGTDEINFKFHTDGTGETINAALGSDEGIGRIRGGLIEPTTHSTPNFEGVGPATSIATEICNNSAVRPIMACMAAGATDLFDEWDHTYGGTGSMYDLMRANVNEIRALNAANEVKTLFWCQGESSTHVGYAAQFKSMIDTLRSVWGEFLVVIMEHGGNAVSAGHINMKAEQQKLATGSGDASELTRCIYVERPTGAALEVDGIHFTGTTNRMRGTEAAQAAVAAGLDQILSAPANTSAPVVAPASGNVGDVLSVSTGTWTGNPPPGFTYQWYLDGAPVSGATSSSVTTDAVGDWTCTITATNSQGSAAQVSNASTIAAAVATIEFSAQHRDGEIASGGGNVPITAGADIDRIIVFNNNSANMGAGDSLENDVLVPAENGLGLRLTAVDNVAVDRDSAATLGNRYSFSTLEYIGDPGGDNEFIVRNRRTVTLSSDTFSYTPTGIVNANKVIPIIMGVRSDLSAGSSQHDHIRAATFINRSTGEVTVEGRGGSGTLTVEIMDVEFVGSNWTVHYGTDNVNALDDYSLTLDGSVVSWANAWIISQFAKNGGGHGGLADTCPMVVPEAGGALNQVDISFEGDHNATTGQRNTVYVLENSEMTVTRYRDDHSSPAPITSDIDISALGLSEPEEALIDITNNISSIGSAHPRGFRSARLLSSTSLQNYTVKGGNDVETALQVIQLPNMGAGSGSSGGSGGGSVPAIPTYDDGDFTVVNLSSGANIQSTINGLSSLAGTKIKLAAGTYDGFEIDIVSQGEGGVGNPLVIEGPASGTARIQARSNEDTVFINGASDIILDRLYIEGATNASKAGLHVKVKGNTNDHPERVQVLRSTIARRSGDGAKFSEVFECMVHTVNFSDDLSPSSIGERHLDFNKFNGAYVYSCEFHSHRAINFKGGSFTMELLDCDFYNCISTVEIGEWAGSGYWDEYPSRQASVDGALVEDNRFTNSVNWDIRFKDTHDAVVNRNGQHSSGTDATDATYNYTNGTDTGNSSFQNSNIVVDGVTVVPAI